jgi:hypothetical protein
VVSLIRNSISADQPSLDGLIFIALPLIFEQMRLFVAQIFQEGEHIFGLAGAAPLISLSEGGNDLFPGLGNRHAESHAAAWSADTKPTLKYDLMRSTWSQWQTDLP